MILFAAECGFTANLVSNSLSFTWRGCIRVAQTNTQPKLQATLWPGSKWCQSFFLSLPPPVPVSIPPSVSPLSPLSLSLWRIRVCLAWGQEWCQCLLQQNREGYRSSLKATSVCVRVSVCVWVTSASSKIDYSAGIYQEVRGVSMHVSETERMIWNGERRRRHMDLCGGLSSFALKESWRHRRKRNNWDQVFPFATHSSTLTSHFTCISLQMFMDAHAQTHTQGSRSPWYLVSNCLCHCFPWPLKQVSK